LIDVFALSAPIVAAAAIAVRDNTSWLFEAMMMARND
jgi:hypothetical protein